jgi:hypothetical protein
MSKDDNPNLIIPNAFLYDGIEIINKSHAIASTTHMCVHCHKLFNILDSVGRWECRQHTGKLEQDPTDQNRLRWSCCGKRQGVLRYDHCEIINRMYRESVPNRPMPDTYTPEGCVRCDHRLVKVWSQPQSHDQDHPAIVKLNNIAGLVAFISNVTERPGFDAAHGTLKRWDFDIVEEAESVAAASPNSLPGEL